MEKYNVFDSRFSRRIQKTFEELDEHGQPSAKLYNFGQLGNTMLNYRGSEIVPQILEIAADLKTLAEKLKD